MFSKKEAIIFLQNSLGVKDVEKRLERDRKNLLDEIISGILANVPFQSITLMTSSDKRKRPSLENVKKDCMAGIGGLCYTVNSFTWFLLKGLGFSGRLAQSTVTSTVTSLNNHLIILVNDLEESGDLYLVDCGTGFPIFRAVPLDFDQESPVYHDGFLEYKYVRHEGKILRMHGKGDMIKRNDPPVEGLDFYLGRWRRFYSFEVELSDSTLDPDQVYSNAVVHTPFPRSPRAIRFPDRRAVVVVHNRVMFETGEGKLDTAVMESDDEIMKAYAKYFPAIKEDVVREAIAEWHRVSK